MSGARACLHCRRPMRSTRQHITDAPGTVRHNGRGLCISCYRKHRHEYDRHERPRDEVLEEVEMSAHRDPLELADALGMTIPAIAQALFRCGREDLARPFWAIDKARRRRAA